MLSRYKGLVHCTYLFLDVLCALDCARVDLTQILDNGKIVLGCSSYVVERYEEETEIAWRLMSVRINAI